MAINKRELYKKLIEHFGKANQFVIAIEELSELQKEICKHIRPEQSCSIHNLAEEIADAKIMIEQLEQIFSCSSEVELLMQQKLERTYERYLKNDSTKGKVAIYFQGERVEGTYEAE